MADAWPTRAGDEFPSGLGRGRADQESDLRHAVERHDGGRGEKGRPRAPVVAAQRGRDGGHLSHDEPGRSPWGGAFAWLSTLPRRVRVSVRPGEAGRAPVVVARLDAHGLGVRVGACLFFGAM